MADFSYKLADTKVGKVVFYSQTQTFVKLTFRCTFTLCELLVEPHIDRNSSYDPEVYTIDMTFPHVDKIQDEKENIRQKLSSWKLNEYELEKLVTYAVTKTKIFANHYVRSGYNDLHFVFDVELKHTQHVAQFDDIEMDQILQMSFEESASNMVPATRESVKSLKRKRAVDQPINKRRKTFDKKCVICLEELFSEGCDVVSMPCKHEFHGGCIEEWLGVSHKCPMCRYEMPTD